MYIFLPFIDDSVPEPDEPVVCYDVRLFDEAFPDHRGKVYDVKLLHGHAGSFHRLTKLLGDDSRRLSELSLKINVHVRTARQAGITDPISVMRRCVDAKLRDAFASEFRRIMLLLHSSVASVHGYDRLLQLARSLHTIERAGIRTDEGVLRTGKHPFLNKLRSRVQDGFIRFRYNPCGTITGRFGVEAGSFNPMSIPHGEPRTAIVSRFEGGTICVLDYNAFDFRSVIHMCGSPRLKELYDGCDDFHARTAEVVMGDASLRSEMKDVIYPVLYGSRRGSGGSVGELRDRLPELFRFRDELEAMAASTGRVQVLDRSIDVANPKDALALAAQTFSSMMFREAIISSVAAMQGHRSRIIFTVHDEIVIDLHPDERSIVDRLVNILEEPMEGYRYRAGIREGRSYGDVEGQGTDHEERGDGPEAGLEAAEA